MTGAESKRTLGRAEPEGGGAWKKMARSWSDRSARGADRGLALKSGSPGLDCSLYQPDRIVCLLKTVSRSFSRNLCQPPPRHSALCCGDSCE